MKNVTIVIILFLFIISVNARSVDYKDIGIKFDLPAIWDSVPVLENNKPRCFFEAERAGNKAEFLTAIAFNSKTQPVDESRLDVWCNEMASALGHDVKIQKPKIISNNNAEWYFCIFKLKDDISLYCFATNLNGYEYSINFARSGTEKKIFEKEINAIIGSVVFFTPASFARVKTDIAQAAKDATGFVMPAGFYLTTQIDPSLICPYAYSLYKSLLEEKNTDLVLVSRVYSDQVFCLNIKKNMPVVGLDVIHLVSNVTANKMRQDGAAYEEVFVGAWDKAPDKVQLQKFRLVKGGTAATVYIFYCQSNEGKNNVIKVQLPSTIEGIFEPDIYQLILKNI